MDSYSKKLDNAANALPRETRQAALDLIRKGLTIGEVETALELSLEEVLGIINQNVLTTLNLGREAR